MDGWLNLAKFLSQTLGIPGALLGGALIYAVWMLQREREDHKETRRKVDEINEKRIELHATYQNMMRDLKVGLEAVTAILGKKP